MNTAFQDLISKATRLTQSGDLQAATAALQAALGVAGPSTPTPPQGKQAWTIDVTAREIPDVAQRLMAAFQGGSQGIPTPQPTRPRHTPQHTPAQGEWISGSHTEAGLTLAYKLFVPPQHGKASLPLIVMLHGCTQNPDDFAAGTGMNALAAEQGCYVLYPAQAQKANAQGCWNWFKHNHQERGRGEPAALAGMTRAVMGRYRVDAQRVYVAGLSAGGAMAAILGETYPDLFAAVGVHSGLARGAASDVTGAFAAMHGGAGIASIDGLPGMSGLAGLPASLRPQTPPPLSKGSGLPTIVFHGDADATVHPVNGERVMAAALASVGQTTPDRSTQAGRPDRSFTRTVHRNTSGAAQWEHWTVHGAGHAWSGGHASGSYTDPQGPNASQEMLRFFLAHPKSQTH